MRPAETPEQKLAIIKELQEVVFGPPAVESTKRGYLCRCGYIGGGAGITQCIGFGDTATEAILACWWEIITLSANQYLFNGALKDNPRQEYILNRQNGRLI